MPKITYIAHNGATYAVEAAEGGSAMQAAIENNIPGIDGDCGGVVACGTCHVYVDEAWAAKLRPAQENEANMLAYIDNAQEKSRLACQIALTADLDGLVLRMPAGQH